MWPACGLIPPPMSIRRWSCRALEPCLFATLVFAPWFFGCSGIWGERILAVFGWFLGLLGLLARPTDRTEAGIGLSKVRSAFVVVAFLFLAYVLVSALNSRATAVVSANGVTLQYHDSIDWLPRTYDAPRTWVGFGKLVAIAGLAFAVWRWAHQPSTDPRSATKSTALPAHFNRLIWLLTISSTLLAFVSIAQKLAGTDRLLFISPRVLPDGVINGTTSFGPFAYQSNGAQFFNLVWPLSLGLWWCHQQRLWEITGVRPRFGASVYSILPFCAAVMMACPFLSNSRAGAVVCIAQFVGILAWVIAGERNVPAYLRLGLVGGVGLAVAIATGTGLSSLWQKFGKISLGLVNRQAIYQQAHRMIADFDPWGSGSETYRTLSDLYTDPSEPRWEAYVHNDWLEAHLSYGWIGFGLILALLTLWLATWFTGPWARVPRSYSVFIAVALAGILAHASVDLPFQILSLHALFAVLAVLAIQCPPPWIRSPLRSHTGIRTHPSRLEQPGSSTDESTRELLPDLAPFDGPADSNASPGIAPSRTSRHRRRRRISRLHDRGRLD